MFVAMNRFKVRPEKEAEFRSRWLDREVLLRTAPGFLMIQFMRGGCATRLRGLCVPNNLGIARGV